MSLLTNLVALGIFLFSYVSPYYGEIFRAVGIFALSGALTNWIAIHMLFEKVPGFYGSGIVVIKFAQFKESIGSLVMNQFFNETNLEKVLKDQTSKHWDTKAITSLIDYSKLYEKLVEAIEQSPMGGMLQMFGGKMALEPLRDPVQHKVELYIAELFEDPSFQTQVTNAIFSGDASQKILKTAKSLVDSRLEELTPKQVKDIIQDMIKSHLGWLVVWGGVFGGIIGLVSVFI